VLAAGASQALYLSLQVPCDTTRVAWVIAIGGIILLIILHEAGHFAAAKAVGMRVERFSLFFPPTIFKVRRGETEYAIGAIPAGGYVKITGMSPEELQDLDPELVPRAYYSQPPWKRIVVILAGPGVNILIALVIFTMVLWGGSLSGANTIGNLAPSVSTLTLRPDVSGILRGAPAEGVLRVGDRIVGIDGRKASVSRIVSVVEADRCAGALRGHCRAARPVALTLVRDHSERTVSVFPRYDKAEGGMKIGFDFTIAARSEGLLSSVGTAFAAMGSITGSTLTGLFHALTSSKARGNLHSIVGITQVTAQAVADGPAYGFVILGLVSMLLGVINLFPFLPLDGGHVLWSVAEKFRGARISTQAMWRFSSVGVVLLLFLVVNGIGNDVSRLAGG
jgi:regulator of sigma E protease